MSRLFILTIAIMIFSCTPRKDLNATSKRDFVEKELFFDVPIGFNYYARDNNQICYDSICFYFDMYNIDSSSFFLNKNLISCIGYFEKKLGDEENMGTNYSDTVLADSILFEYKNSLPAFSFNYNFIDINNLTFICTEEYGVLKIGNYFRYQYIIQGKVNNKEIKIIVLSYPKDNDALVSIKDVVAELINGLKIVP